MAQIPLLVINVAVAAVFFVVVVVVEGPPR